MSMFRLYCTDTPYQTINCG